MYVMRKLEECICPHMKNLSLQSPEMTPRFPVKMLGDTDSTLKIGFDGKLRENKIKKTHNK